MSQWGMTLEEAQRLTDGQIRGLLGAYVQRTQFEAKVLIGTLGEALAPSEKGRQLDFNELSSMGFHMGE